MAAREKPIKARFEDAKARVEKLREKPSNEKLLQLYGLYKQATEGDVKGTRPGMLDLRGRAKFDAWTERKGLAADEAMKKYVALVDQLQREQG